jgi:nitrogen regulatory protein PII
MRLATMSYGQASRERAMKLITAFIRPFRLAQVREALISAGIVGMTATMCCGHGRDPEFVESLRGVPDVPELLPTVKIEVVVPTIQCEATQKAIVSRAGTGKSSRGKLFVSQIERMVTIRTGLDEADGLETDPMTKPRKMVYPTHQSAGL